MLIQENVSRIVIVTMQPIAEHAALFDARRAVGLEHQPLPVVDVTGLESKLGGDDDGFGHEL
jgi:hypothetical protein